MIRFSICGAASYACGELLRLMVNHPETQVAHLADSFAAGRRIQDEHPALMGFYDQEILPLNDETIAQIVEDSDVVFTAVDAGTVCGIAEKVLAGGKKFIDFGADIRFRDAKVWEKWYHLDHPNYEMTKEAVYCIPEIQRDLAKGKSLISNPGCYPTATTLGLYPALKEGLAAAGLPEDALQLVEDTSRASANELMTASGYVDLLIPRGGAGLIRACVDNATVPVIETGTGICHIYVDQWADQGMALDILENAKCSRPSVCNAAEVCLVDRKIAGEFLPKLKARLVDGRAAAGQPPVELRLDETAAAVIDGAPAGERDFDTEFLDYILAVRVVDGVEGAVAHIAAHSTGHSECIVTGDEKAAHAFQRQVDSAAVYWNASTRFTDGGEFGLGCEMGISTQKLHARGPLGLAELCTFKFIARGSGQIR